MLNLFSLFGKRTSKKKTLEAKRYYDDSLGFAGFGAYGKALFYLDGAIKLKPDYAEAYYLRGHVKSQIGEYNDSILDLNTAINLKSNFIKAYEERFKVNYNLDRLLEAISDINKVISLTPKDTANSHLNFVNRAHVKKDVGDYLGAIADFDKVLEMMPCGNYMHQRGIIKAMLGDYVGAISDYDKTIELDKNANRDVYFDRSDAKYHQGDNLSAITDYEKALELPDNWDNLCEATCKQSTDEVTHHIKAARTKYKNQDYSGAITECGKYFDLRPYIPKSLNVFVYYIIANSKYHIKDYLGAIANYDEVLSWTTDNLLNSSKHDNDDLIPDLVGKIFLLRGLSYYAINQNEKGCNDIQEAKHHKFHVPHIVLEKSK